MEIDTRGSCGQMKAHKMTKWTIRMQVAIASIGAVPRVLYCEHDKFVSPGRKSCKLVTPQ